MYIDQVRDHEEFNSIIDNPITGYKYIRLNSFFDSLHQCTSKKDVLIVNTHTKKNYTLTTDQINEMFDILNDLRKVDTDYHICERQYSENVTHSGITIDLDIFSDKCFNPEVILPFQDDIIKKFAKQIIKNLSFSEEFEAFAFILARRASTLIDEKYKYGIHVLFPTICVKKEHKKVIIDKLIENEKLNGFINDNFCIPCEKSSIDRNSFSFVNNLFGSRKTGIGFKSYVLNGCYHFLIKQNKRFFMKNIGIEEFNDFNLVRELSLTFQAEKAVKKIFEFDNPQSESNYQDYDDELTFGPDLSDGQIRTIIKLVSILPSSYYDDRNKWRDLIYSLANTSESLKSVADEFSKKSDKYDKDAFEELWNKAIENKDRENVITIRSLYHWARIESPNEYKNIINNLCSQLIKNIVNRCNGQIGHVHVASILQTMFKDKYIYDGATWWQYVTDQDDDLSWKWRQERIETIDLFSAMNPEGPIIEQLTDTILSIRLNLDSKTNVVAKYLKSVARSLEQCKKNLAMRPFRTNCVVESSRLFYSRDILERMDNDSNLIGCKKGIIKINKSSGCAEYINYQNEYLVSRMAPCGYHHFDPLNPTEKEMIVLKWMEDVIFESDARNKILFYLSTGIVGGAKASVMLLWEGSGTNGKSSVLNLWNNTLGRDYAAKLDIGILTFKRTDANSPKSAIYAIKGKRACWFDETDRMDHLTASMLKTLVNSGGQISVSEKYKTQEMIKVQATFVHLSNYSFIIREKDIGTWRRIMLYKSKIKFCMNPDPSNEHEKMEDKRYNDEYINDPEIHEAFFGILVYYYENLVKMFRGNIKEVPSPTIEWETKEFRKSQDKMTKFISENIVYNEHTGKIPLSELISEYNEWLNVHYQIRRDTDNYQETQKDFENSILKSYMTELPNGNKVLEKCRILTDKSREISSNDIFLNLNGKLENADSDRPETFNVSRINEPWWIF